MKKDISFLPRLFTNHLVLWILWLILTMSNIYFLGYIAGRMYPSEIDDMGRALVQQLRVKLVFLAVLIVVIPTIINTIEIFYNDLARNGEKKEAKQPYFRFSFDPAILKEPVPYIVAKALIIIEAAFIASLMVYLRENYYNALNNSMDFLIGAPYLAIAVASLSLVINCLLIFCILLFSFLWGYSWVQWVSDKIFPNFSDSRYYSFTLLFTSLIFRALNILGLAFVINFMATFSGKFETVVKIIHEITILLFLWVGIYIVPYWRERSASKKNRIVEQ